MIGIDDLDHAGKAELAGLDFRRHDMPCLQHCLIADRLGALQILTLFVGKENAALVQVEKVARHGC